MISTFLSIGFAEIVLFQDVPGLFMVDPIVIAYRNTRKNRQTYSLQHGIAYHHLMALPGEREAGAS